MSDCIKPSMCNSVAAAVIGSRLLRAEIVIVEPADLGAGPRGGDPDRLPTVIVFHVVPPVHKLQADRERFRKRLGGLEYSMCVCARDDDVQSGVTRCMPCVLSLEQFCHLTVS